MFWKKNNKVTIPNYELEIDKLKEEIEDITLQLKLLRFAAMDIDNLKKNVSSLEGERFSSGVNISILQKQIDKIKTRYRIEEYNLNDVITDEVMELIDMEAFDLLNKLVSEGYGPEFISSIFAKKAGNVIKILEGDDQG
tara:strand:+ start:46 stop:462 length:417 start_codon:yes stop_codon:yes gene_type:complete